MNGPGGKRHYYKGEDTEAGYRAALKAYYTERNELEDREAYVNGVLKLVERMGDTVPDVRDRDLRVAMQGEDTTASVANCIQQFLDMKETEIDTGDLSVSRYGVLRCTLAYFTNWEGCPRDVNAIKEAVVDDYYAYLGQLTKGVIKGRRIIAPKYAKECFNSLKQWLKWAYVQRHLDDLPRNHDKESRFAIHRDRKAKREQIKGSGKHAWPAGYIEKVLADCTETTELYHLLALNCGMTQKDISDLHPEEVNWRDGTITRTRSKTNDTYGTYTIWRRTFELLKKHGNRDGEHVLTNQHGHALLRTGLKVNRRGKKVEWIDDNIRSACDRVYRKLVKRGEMTKQPTIGTLRHTGATMLATNEQHRGFVDHYLCHAEAEMSVHYVSPKAFQSDFDKAIAWLGRQFKLA